MELGQLFIKLRLVDLASQFLLSGLLLLPPINKKPIEHKSMDFFANQTRVDDMFRALVAAGILHRMVLLDRVARCVEKEHPIPKPFTQPNLERAFNHKGHYFHTAVDKFFSTMYADETLAFQDTAKKQVKKTQLKMIEDLLADLEADINEVWVEHGSLPHSPFVFAESSIAPWWKEVKRVLLLGAEALDATLKAHSMEQTSFNLLCGFHLTNAAASHDKQSLKSYCEHVSGQKFAKLEIVQAVEDGGKRHINLPTNIVAKQQTKGKKGKKRKLPEIAGDIAYWVKIDPKHLASLDWCLCGMVVGFYPEGAGPPTVHALFVCVVTTRPTRLEFPSPYASAPAVAVAVLGRAPVFMEPPVLPRLYNSGISGNSGGHFQLYYTDQGRVDFEDENNTIDYTTAKYIGDVTFDKNRFHEDGTLKKKFQGVKALPVFVVYKAVPWSLFVKCRDSVLKFVESRYATKLEVRVLATIFMCLLLIIVVVVIMVPRAVAPPPCDHALHGNVSGVLFANSTAVSVTDARSLPSVAPVREQARPADKQYLRVSGKRSSHAASRLLDVNTAPRGDVSTKADPLDHDPVAIVPSAASSIPVVVDESDLARAQASALLQSALRPGFQSMAATYEYSRHTLRSGERDVMQTSSLVVKRAVDMHMMRTRPTWQRNVAPPVCTYSALPYTRRSDVVKFRDPTLKYSQDFVRFWDDVFQKIMSPQSPLVFVIWHPVVEGWYPGVSDKPLGVHYTTGRTELCSKFLGGVYYFDVEFSTGAADLIVQDVSKQLFGADYVYANLPHYPEYANARLIVLKQPVLIVLYNVARSDHIDAVSRMVKGAGMVVATAREVMTIDGGTVWQVPQQVVVKIMSRKVQNSSMSLQDKGLQNSLARKEFYGSHL